MKMILSFVLLFSLCSFSQKTLAQVDQPNSEDHPLLTRYPGSYIASYEKIKYQEYSLAKGPITGYRYIGDRDTIAGQIYRITYAIDKSPEELSISEVYKDYLQAFQKAELSILAKGLILKGQRKHNEVGSKQWIGVALKDNRFSQKSAANYLFKGSSSSGGSFAITGSVNRPDRMTYVAIYAKRYSSKTVYCHVDILEVKNAEVGNVSINADYMKSEIDERGKVIIYGIHFDFDSDQIKEESRSTLDEIAAFLKVESKLSIYVTGHTDMKGTLDYNIALSKRRADAISNELINTYQIEASRLEAQGLGPLAPKSTNDTEEGRQLNRRVELVKKN